MAVVSSLRALQSRSKRKSVTHSPNLSDHGNGASVLSQLLLTNPNANNRYVADMLDYPNVAAPFEYTRGVERAGLCRSEEHTSELQSLAYLVCRLLLEKKKKQCTGHDRRCSGSAPRRAVQYKPDGTSSIS